jgi:hypothetical protein
MPATDALITQFPKCELHNPLSDRGILHPGGIKLFAYAPWGHSRACLLTIPPGVLAIADEVIE